MAGNIRGKRSAPTPSVVSKKRKLNNGKKVQVAYRTKPTRKEKAADRGIIPIPNLAEDDENVELSDQDMALFADFGQGVGFLKKLDHNGLMRSKKATQKLNQLSKPIQKPQVYDDDLPSLNSDDDGEEDEWSSNINDDDLDNLDDSQSIPPTETNDSDDSDAEMPYETIPRKLPLEWRTSERTEVRALPIKLADGKIKDTGVKVVLNEEEDDFDSDGSDKGEGREETTVEDVSTGARFGRPAVVDVLQTRSRKKRVEKAKEQIASICQEILADPENSLGLLRRLHTFALPTVTTPTHPEPVSNDHIIRQLTLLSQLAVFKDIIPGYRIRPLTEIEKAEKVSQMVARTRDWEQGLVSVYQAYLRLLEAEFKGKSDFADVAMHCMCTLLTEVTHFNFRVNLMTCIVSRLSRRTWDKTSEQCSQSLITVFRRDLTGEPSLEIVRLINRMIKERQYKIHPNVLSCLLHLRLRTELGIRASNQSVDKPEITERKSLKKKSHKVHLSKKTRKSLKEQKEIRKELREAEAEVDKEERKATQTETLKLLFTLYFRILKNPSPSSLLPSALSGISKFAHLVNIDFFKDLMKTLKVIISKEEELAASGNDMNIDLVVPIESVSRSLMCIVTAFELLSGQGEALDIDLSEFIAMLYANLMTVTFAGGEIESIKSDNPGNANATDLLFRALDIVFTPRASASVSAGVVAISPWRAAAFAKRLLSACIHWPTTSPILRALEFVKSMVARDPKVEAMLSTEDRISNGVYRPDVDDPQLCQPFETAFWELHLLRQQHWDPRVREEAEKLLNYSSR